MVLGDNGGECLAEEVARTGPEGLSDDQLLSLVIREPSPAFESSRAIVGLAGGAGGLSDVTFCELLEIAGVGPSRAAAVLAAVELGRRTLAGVAPGARLGASREAYHALLPSVAGEKNEIFCCAMVDAKLRLIRTDIVSRGTLTASIIHPRDAFRPAVRHSASAVIFAHNHPSGDPVPSDEDRRITGRLEDAGHILGIPVLDHLVIGSNSFYSFADSGDLEARPEGYRGMLLR